MLRRTTAKFFSNLTSSNQNLKFPLNQKKEILQRGSQALKKLKNLSKPKNHLESPPNTGIIQSVNQSLNNVWTCIAENNFYQAVSLIEEIVTTYQKNPIVT